MNAFDPGPFKQSVAATLIRGRPDDLDALCRQTLAADESLTPFQLARVITETCLELGRRKQARHWLERSVADAAEAEVPSALALALRAGQPAIVLTLYGRMQDLSLPAPEEALGLARETFLLAKCLRLPHGRNHAWEAHKELLGNAGRLLEQILPMLPATGDVREEAESLSSSLHRLLGKRS